MEGKVNEATVNAGEMLNPTIEARLAQLEMAANNRSEKSATQSIDVWGGRISSWSQLLMLALVFWGYMETVRPAFQKEQLSEDLARLQLEERRSQERLERVKQEVIAARKVIDALEFERAGVNEAIVKLKAERQAADKQASDATRLAKVAREDAVEAKQALERSYDSLLESRKSAITGSLPLSPSMVRMFNGESYVSVFEAEKQFEVATRLKATVAQPKTAIEETIANLEKVLESKGNNAVEIVNRRLLKEFKDGYEKHSDQLVCPEPDYSGWQQSYVAAIAQGKQKATRCAEMLMLQLIEENGWSKSSVEKLKKTEYWPRQMAIYSNTCSVSTAWTVNEVFRSRWKDFDEKCNNLHFKSDSIVLGELDIGVLGKIDVPLPPTASEIEAAIDKATKQWVKVSQ